MSKILIVEDEQDLASQVADWLKREHYLCETVDNGAAALDRLRVYQYDVVLLDWMLPGMTGIEVCKQFRGRGGKTPILMLTAKSQEDDKETGLDIGADDYLVKPFGLKELSARIRALIRRTSISTQAVGKILNYGKLELDPTSRRVTKEGAEVHLEPKEFSLLEFFMRNPDQVFSAEALINRCWESETLMSPDSIRTYIKGLRKKIDDKDGPSTIVTVHGVGYRFGTK